MSVNDVNAENVRHQAWFYEKKIPNNICDSLIEEFQKCEFSYGTIGQDRNVNSSIRFVETVAVPMDHWCLGILLYYGCDANVYNFNFDIKSLESGYFLKYNQGMYYRPHSDVSNDRNSVTYNRKLTVTVQLSNEDDYEGGDIHLYDSSLRIEKVPRTRGSIVVFDSSITHSVTKIKRGTRYSLCGWIYG